MDLKYRVVFLIYVFILLLLANKVFGSFDNEQLKKNDFYGVNCQQHKIYCHIKRLKPNMDKNKAFKLSNVIYRKAIKFKLNPKLVTAILMQESSFNIKAKNCFTGISMWSKEVFGEYTKDKVCADFGISQINWKTANNFGMDIEKLTTDLEYSVEAGTLILADFKKRYSKKEIYWWTRYNSSSPKHRLIYRKAVLRWM